MYKFVKYLLLILIPFKEGVAGTCYVSGSNVSFGHYIKTVNNDAVGTFFVRCNDDATYTYCVKINTLSGASPNRLLTRAGGGQTLTYELYRDASRSTIWQNNACTYVTGSCPFSTSSPSCQHLIYGRIPLGQNKGNGAYADTIQVSLDINPTIVTNYAQAFINNGCSISTDLFNFGFYSPVSSSDLLVQAANIHVNCASSLAYTIGLSAGNSGNINDRYMLNGANQLHYNFYTTNSYSNIWGAASVSGTGTGSTQNYTVYGKIVKNQSALVGGYRDVITATVTY